MSKKYLRIFWAVAALCLLVSTLGCSGEQALPTWEKVFDPTIESVDDYQIYTIEAYKDQLYATVSSFTDTFSSSKDGLIYRSSDGKTWTPVTGMKSNLGGYDHIADLTVFQDKLYIILGDWQGKLPGEILRTSDGIDFEAVLPSASSSHGLENMVVFKDMVYVNGHKDNTSHIWRSASGDKDTWTEVADFPGALGTFEIFKDWLYTISDREYLPDSNTRVAISVWRSQDGMTWEKVVSDGFGNPANTTGGGFEVFNGYLYAGTGNFEGSGVGQIFRSKDGVKWEPVIQDGFGDEHNIKVDGLVAYRKYLYAYTFNGEEGCMVYRTKDGKDWVLANEPGWGDASNWTSHLNQGQAEFKGNLYMGIFGQKGGLLKMVNQ